MIRKQLFLLPLLCFITFGAYCQFTSSQSGYWDIGTTWGGACAGGCTEGVDYPGPADNAIISAGHTVTIPAGVTISRASGSTTTLNGILAIEDDGLGGNGIFDVSGTLINNQGGSFSGDTEATIIFNSGGLYRHNYTTTAGNLVIGTWSSGSTCEVVGYTTNTAAPGNLGQSFHHFTWNCASFVGGGTTASINFAGQLTTVNGDLTVANTGGSSRTLRLFDTTGGSTLIIGGNIIISGSARLVFSTTGIGNSVTASNFTISNSVASTTTMATNGSTTLTLTGAFTINSTAATTFVMSSLSGGTASITMADFTMSPTTASTVNLGSASGAGGTLNISGNFSINSSSTVTRSATAGVGVAAINFTGASTRTFTNSGTISNAINFTIANGKTLDLGTSAITGTGAFNLNAGGTLRVGSTHVDGALQLVTTAGNIRVPTGLRTYASNSNIVYNGASAQFVGNGFPSNVNLEISNVNGVTNNNVGTTNVVGNLTLTTGAFNIGNSNTVNIQSNFFTTNNGFIGGDATSNLTFSGSGTMNTLRFSPGTEFLNNLTVGRVGDLVLGSNLTISGTLDLSFGNLDFSGRSLVINGGPIGAASTGLKSNGTSNLTFGGSTFTGTIPFSGVGNALNTVTFATAGGTYTWGSAVTINNNVTLTAGALTHSSGLTMAANSTFFKGAGSITGASPAAVSSYNVYYTGNGNTGVELPSSTTGLNNLTVDVSTTLTLTQPITVNGTLRFEAGTFDAGSNAMDLKGNLVTLGSSILTNSVITFSGTTIISGTPGIPTFGSIIITGTVTPNTNHQINGNLTNNGTLNSGGGTLTFGGTSTILGSSTSTFNNIVINTGSSLTAHATAMNISGNLILNGTGTFNHNSGTVNFTGTTSITGVPTFNHMNVTGILNGPSTLNAAGNFSNTGTFNPGSGTFNITGNYTNNLGGTHSSGTGNLNITGQFTNNGSFNAGSSTVRVATHFTNNSTFNASTGTVVFNGSTIQLISGSVVTDFNNINVTNATGGPPAVRVQSNQNLRGVLTLAAGSQFDADGSAGTAIFTLVSSNDDPTADAAIAILPAGASVTGSVTVQRHMSIEGAFNGRIYRFISSPVNASAVSQIQTEIPVTGSFTGSSTCQGCSQSFQSMLQYNENVITDTNGDTFTDLNDGFADFPAATNAETLVNGKGYTIYVRANIAPISTAGSARWDVRAPINSGTINFNSFTTFTSSGNVANDGWNYVGNPYPSTIDWDAASGWTRTGINNAIYMKDNGTNLMASYVGGVPANGGSRYIAMGQGFVVKSDGGPINFQANENVKAPGTQTTFFREAPIKDLLRIALNNGSLKDETVIRFAEGATEGFDNAVDAYKYINKLPEGGDNDEDIVNLKKSILNFSSISAGAKWVINTLPKSTCSATVPLDVSEVVPGSYSLEFSEFETFETPVQIRLIDNFLGESIDVTQNPLYSFEVTSDPNSFGNRFSISFGKSSVVTDLSVSGQDICAGSNAAVHLAASQSGVTYFASIDGNSVSELVSGNGSDLSITINDANLATGSNNIMIMAAYPGCDPVPLNQKIMMKKEAIPHVISVQGGTNCREGQASLSASGAPVDGWYNWYESEDAITAIDDQHGAQFITPTLNKTKTYYVSVSNALGCEGPRAEVKAEVIHYEDAVVTVFEDRLVSSYNEGNQWYKDGQEISGATGKELVPTESGRYGVRVSVGPCSTGAEVDYLVTSTEYSGLTNTNIYPNPTNSSITIEVQSSNEVTVDLYNPLGLRIEHGIKLKESKKGIQTGQINFTSQASGFYIVKIKDGIKTHQKKILKK